MSTLHPIHSENYLYHIVVGTGGIGSGIFFALDKNDTLGRNESRQGQLLPFKDYCKQHIILHYLSVLLGAGKNKFGVHPIGKVGNDETGKSLISQMKAAGMNVDHVKVDNDAATLFSVCFQYPDKSGGNITTGNSASGLLTDTDIDQYFKENVLEDKKGIVLSAPEVPLSARIRLLEHGRRMKFLNVSSVLSAEADEFKKMGGFKMTDILSVNMDEAEQISKLKESKNKEDIINACVQELTAENPDMAILITNGANGVYCFSNKELIHFPSFRVAPVSTAGAGDAFIAGTICGLCCGLPLAEKDKSGALHSAIELGTLLAALSVTSADTIHLKADADELYAFIKKMDIPLSDSFLKVVENKK